MSRVHSATVIAKTPSLKGCLPNNLNLGQEPRRKPRAGGRGFQSGVRVTVVSAFHPREPKAATPREEDRPKVGKRL
jgi:hypothetical protein